MSPRTWKSSSTLSSSRALRSRPARSIWPLPFSGGGGEQVERGQLVIVAEREAGLAGKHASALSSDWAWPPAAIGLAGSATATAGRERGGVATPSSSVGTILAVAARPRRRRGRSRRSLSAAHCFSSGRMPSASQPMANPPSARIAISASRSGPSICGIADQPDRGIDAIGSGQPKCAAIAGRKARNGRTGVEAERDADQRDAERRDQQRSPHRAGIDAAHHPAAQSARPAAGTAPRPGRTGTAAHRWHRRRTARANWSAARRRRW